MLLTGHFSSCYLVKRWLKLVCTSAFLIFWSFLGDFCCSMHSFVVSVLIGSSKLADLGLEDADSKAWNSNWAPKKCWTLKVYKGWVRKWMCQNFRWKWSPSTWRFDGLVLQVLLLVFPWDESSVIFLLWDWYVKVLVQALSSLALKKVHLIPSLCLDKEDNIQLVCLFYS